MTANDSQNCMNVLYLGIFAASVRSRFYFHRCVSVQGRGTTVFGPKSLRGRLSQSLVPGPFKTDGRQRGRDTPVCGPMSLSWRVPQSLVPGSFWMYPSQDWARPQARTPFKLSHTILSLLPIKMCQSHHSLLIAHWVHDL